jgi:hypothetical protein
MALNTTKNHRLGFGCYEINTSDILYMSDNSDMDKLFTETGTFQFQIDGQKRGFLFSKGDPDNLNNASWFIINDDGYLIVILVNSITFELLIFKSNNRILNTQERKLYSLKWDNDSKNLTVLLNSISTPIQLITSNPVNDLVSGIVLNSTSSFTGTNITNENVYTSNFYNPNNEFTLYYDTYKNVLKSEAEINDLYQILKDTRTLPLPMGKILVSTDINNTGFDELHIMNEDGTDEVLEISTNFNISAPKFSKTAGDYSTYVFSDKLTGGNYIKIPSLAYFHANGVGDNINSKGIALFKDGINALFATGNTTNPWIRYQNINTFSAVDFGGAMASSGLAGGDIDTSNTVNFGRFIYASKSYSSNPSYLVEYNNNTNLITNIFINSFVSTDRDIDNIRYNSDDSKIGLSLKVLSTDSEKSACIINRNGTGLQVLEPNSKFCAWINDNKILFSKKITIPTVGERWRLHTRDLITNEVVNISGTSGNYNHYSADYKA